MSATFVAISVFAILAGLLALRTSIALALLMSGTIGYAWLDGTTSTLHVLAGLPGELIRGYSLSVVPLFVLMGVVAGRSSMARRLYEATRLLARPGARASLATATIGACGVFGAICGSSIATAATMTPVTLPEMRRHGYDPGFAAGTVAAGGTLGILIPPSVILIIYALLAEQSISTLFAAALPMGILLALFCILVAKALVWRRPGLAPALTARSADSRTRIVALAATWKIALVFGISLGGIYLGWFSPTEAAAVGAGLAILVAVAGGELSRRDLAAAFDETLVTSAQIFFIFLGGLMFARFVALTQIPVTLTEAVRDLGLAPVAVILIMVAIYVVLGCILETVSMILVTVPVFLPLVMELGYDPVWFGLLVVIVAEMGLITPPVGLNVFVIRSQVGDISLATMFRGVAPFLLAHGLLIGVMILFPGAVMLLPSLLGL